MVSAFQVTCHGKTKAPLDWIKGQTAVGGLGRANVRDLVNAVAAVCLAPHFENKAPEYPRFGVLVTRANRAQAAQDALRWMKGATRTQQAVAVLDALKLHDGERLEPSHSPYATAVLDLLKAKGPGQVLNRSEIFQTDHGVEFFSPDQFRLEPEWVVVLLGALVHTGHLVLVIPGRKLDAANFDLLVSAPVTDLAQFKHVEPPRGWNLPALAALFELLGRPSGLAQMVAQGQSVPITQMATDVEDFVNRLVLAERHLQGGFPFWGRSLLSQQEQTQIQNRLQATKAFLESLQAYTNPNQLRNFDRDASAVREQKAGLDALREVEHLQKLVTWLGPAAGYLSQAEVILPEDHPWVRQVREANRDVQEQIKSLDRRRAIAFAQQVNQRLEELIKGYLAAYITLHARARLGVNDQRRRAGLLRDQRLDRLRKLAAIDLVPGGQLAELENRLKNLIACPKLTEQDLQAGPLCPHCRFNPALEKSGPPLANVLTSIDEELDRLLSAWTKTLLDNLQDSAVRANLDLLAPRDRKPVAAFLKSGTLPDDLTSDFIRALREVFSGLVKVVLRPNELRAALLNGGTPATLPETRKRFDDYLGALAGENDPSKVRVVLE